MIIQDVEMQCQNDPDFADEIMTSPPWQRYTKGNLDHDFIKEFGCWLTSLLNCSNLFHKGIKYLNLKELNDEVKKQNGYNYLYYKQVYRSNINMIKEKCFGKESFLVESIIKKILGIEDIIDDYKNDIDIDSKNDFYIIKTKFNKTGHYSMITHENKSYLDSYDLRIKYPEDYIKIKKIIF